MNLPQPSLRQIGHATAVILVLVAIVWFFFVPDREVDEPRSPTVSTVEPAPATQPSTALSPATSTVAPEPTCDGPTAELDESVSCFLASWYLLTPEDTTETRQERVESYIDLTVFSSMESLEVYRTSVADQARIDQNLTERASTYSIVSEPFDELQPDDVWYVSATALKWVETQGGEPVPDRTPENQLTESYWLKVNGVWKVLSFNETWEVG